MLFGGMVGDAVTWEWDGSVWLPHTQASGPVGRYWHALVWHGVGQKVVLIGGMANNLPLSDVWEWDGTTWATRTPITPPPQNCTPVYDGTLRKVVCFSPNSSTPYVYLP